MYLFGWLKSEYHYGNNVVAAAQAGIATRIVASRAVARGAGNACIRHIAGVRFSARYQKQDDGDQA